MSCLLRSRPTTAGRRIPGLECLESRHVLSAVTMPPGILAVHLEPSSGAGQELVISFDQADVDAITNDFSIPFQALINDFDANTDFELDGPAGTVFGSSDPPAVENVVQNGDSTDVIIPLTAPLPAGSYQVSLQQGSNLDFAFSLIDASDTDPFWTSLANSFEPATIASFTVQPQTGATLAQATNLGLIGPTVETIPGTLDLANVQSSVDVYQFTLAPGHLWEVGLEVFAQSIGSSLKPALSLFDGQGNVIATSNSGTGLPADPDDPYLFAGLEPGSYYVGISGAGNLPGEPGGYNPVTGVPGSVGLTQAAGPLPFELSLAAIPHDQSTQLVGFSLGHEDPLNPSPTSLTLNFSGPIDVAGLMVPDQQETALDVVDSSGHLWPVTAMSYQANDAQLTMVFDEPLPAGSYTLVVPATGGLTDLAGVPVIAPGEPVGVLASWTVASTGGPKKPNDLGVLWPSTADVVWPSASGSFSIATTLTPGQDATYRWVVIVPGTYKLQTQVVGSSIAVVNSSGTSATVLDAGSTNGLNDYLMTLSAGVYELRLTNVGSQSAVVQSLLKIESLDWEKIFNNGVSQSSALSLMTFSSPQPASVPGAETGLLSVPPAADGADFGSSIGPIPSSMLVTLTTSLAGQPSWDGQAYAGPGLATESGMAGQALIDRYGPLFGSADTDNNDGLAMIHDDVNVRETEGDPIHADAETPRTSPMGDAAGTHADIRALAQSEWLTRIGSVIQDWLAPSRPNSGSHFARLESPSAGTAAAQEPELLRKDPAKSWRNRHVSSMVRRELGATASLLAVGAVAYRLRYPLKKWWHERRRSGSWNCPPTRLIPGPHPVSKISRLKTHVRS